MAASLEVGDLEAPLQGIAVGVSDDAEAPGSEYAEVEVPAYASTLLTAQVQPCKLMLYA